MASITIEASKVARKSPIRVDSSLVGTVSGVEDVSVSLPSSKARLSVGKLGLTLLRWRMGKLSVLLAII